MKMNCMFCGIEFEARGAKKYCSVQCQRKARCKRNYPMKPHICPNCNKEFIPEHTNMQKYCSSECRRKDNYNKNKDKIDNQNKEYRLKNIEKVKLKRKERYHANAEEFKEKSRQWRLKNHERYLNKLNINHDLKRYGGNKEKVLERDSYKCTKCGNINDLIIHHIDESGQTETPNNSMDNLTTLCRPCHLKLHNIKINPNPRNRVKCICLNCGKEFEVVPSKIKNGRGKYCSRECKNKHKSN